MCFDYDCDWFASVQEINEGAVGTVAGHCEECAAAIPPGVPHTHVFMQENEQYEDDTPDDPFDPGETFECRVCPDCSRLRQTVKAAEIEAGCHPNNALPPFGMLSEAIHEAGGDSEGRYRRKAMEMFPGLPGEYLDRMLGTGGES